MTSTSLQFPLDSGERQLWAGVPQQGIAFGRSDIFQIPFSLLWGGFAVFWEVGVVASGAPWFFAIWGIPFVLMGAYITVGRFFVDARRRARTTYAVTSDRVIINSGIFTPTTKSLSLRTLSDITLEERSNGRGTISFGAGTRFSAFTTGASWPGGTQPPSFEMIADARRVYDIIREAQKAQSAGAV